MTEQAASLTTSFRIVTARAIDDCSETVDLQERTWSRDLVIPPSVLLSAVHVGGFVALGYAGGDPQAAGFVFGFLGLLDGRLHHHSQRLAVRPEYRHMGLAVALKEAQREHCLRQGIDSIGWTMDPLQPRNARFNFRKLRATTHTYLVDFYGGMQDPINAGLPSDRLYIDWQIEGSSANIHQGAFSSIEDAERAGAVYVLRSERDRPVPGATGGARLVLLEVPADIDTVKSRSMDRALAWRLITRDAFAAAFADGYKAIDLLQDRTKVRGAYLLVRQ